MKGKQLDKYGFTLMEVIVASLILVLAVGGVLFVFSSEKGSVAHTGRQVQAMFFPRQTLEQFKDEVGADTWPGGTLAATSWTAWQALPGNFGSAFSGQRRYKVENIDANNTFDSDGDSDPTNDIDYKEVTVSVQWQEPAE